MVASVLLEKSFAGSESRNAELAAAAPVVVLPHHLGPSMSTAPKASRRSARSESMILGR